jgi:hypothetical protein
MKSREPSIHITLSDFKEIAKELGIDDVANEFFRMARKRAINSRSILVSNNKINKQVNNVLLANQGDAQMVADIIYATRIKLKHKGVRKINQGNLREWNNCKKLAEICNTFCQDFELPTREGFIKYIELGIKKMPDARGLTTRLIGLQDSITEEFSAIKEIQELSPKDKQTISQIQDFYVRQIADRTGIYEPIKDPGKFTHFIRLYDFLNKKGWNYKEYIIAQFEGLAWCNGIPELSQLTSEKAISRYNKYLYKHGEDITQEDDEEGSLWDKINQKDD